MDTVPATTKLAWTRSDTRAAVLLGLFATVLVVLFFNMTWQMGDDSRYYVLAKTLASGQGFIDERHPDHHPEILTPPAHPYALSLLIRVFGPGLRSGKVFSAVLYVMGFVMVFLALRHAASGDRRRAVCATLLAMCCIGILTMSSWVMAEMHYIFFSYLTLFLLLRRGPGFSRVFALAVGVLAAYCYQLRGVGLSMVAAVGLYALLKREWRTLPFLVAAMLAVALPWMIRNAIVVGAPDTYISHLSQMAGKSGGMAVDWARIPSDVATAFPKYFGQDLPNAFFFQMFDGRNFLDLLRVGFLAPVVRGAILALVLLGFCLRLRRFTILEVYWVCYWLIICSPPMAPQGNWYIYPVLPVAALYLFEALERIGALASRPAGAAWPRHTAAAVTVLCALYAATAAAGAGLVHFRKEHAVRHAHPWAAERYLRYKNEYMDACARYAEAAEWIGSHAPQDAVVASRKPQHTFLFSGRKGWRLDVPESIGATSAWHSVELMAARHPVYMIEDAFKGYSGATFSYGAHREAVLRPLFEQHGAAFDLVHGTEAPTTRVWRITP